MKIDYEALDPDVLSLIAKLRQEASRFRRQRNGARAEADALRAELAELKARTYV
jgi:hypothetical protein